MTSNIKKARIRTQVRGLITQTTWAQFFKRCCKLEGQNQEKTQKLEASKIGMHFSLKIKAKNLKLWMTF